MPEGIHVQFSRYNNIKTSYDSKNLPSYFCRSPTTVICWDFVTNHLLLHFCNFLKRVKISDTHSNTEIMPVVIVPCVDATAAPEPLRHRLHLGDRRQVAVVGRAHGSHGIIERWRVSVAERSVVDRRLKFAHINVQRGSKRRILGCEIPRPGFLRPNQGRAYLFNHPFYRVTHHVVSNLPLTSTLLFWSQREVSINVMCHPVQK